MYVYFVSDTDKGGVGFQLKYYSTTNSRYPGTEFYEEYGCTLS